MFETIFICLVIAALGLAFFGKKSFQTPKTTPSDERTYRQFQAVKSVFVNPSEMAFFHALRRELPDGYYLLSKVRLEDIIGVKPSVKSPEIRWKLRGRVKSRHVDFLVVDEIGTPCLAIELDGEAHLVGDSFNADTLKNGLFRAANIPLERVLTRENFSARAEKLVSKL